MHPCSWIVHHLHFGSKSCGLERITSQKPRCFSACRVKTTLLLSLSYSLASWEAPTRNSPTWPVLFIRRLGRGRGPGRGRGRGPVLFIRRGLPVILVRCRTVIICLQYVLIAKWCTWPRESRWVPSSAMNILPSVGFGIKYWKFSQTNRTKEPCSSLTLFDCFKANGSVPTIITKFINCFHRHSNG